MQTIDNVDNHGNNDDKDYPELPRLSSGKQRVKLKSSLEPGMDQKLSQGP